MWRCPFKLYFEALALTEKMNRLLLWTPVHLHRASFSTTKHNMCGRVLCKLQLQHLKNLADAWVSGQWCRCTISPEPGIWTKSQPSSQKPCPVNLLVSKCEISKPGRKRRKWSSQDGKVALARKPRLSHLLTAKFSNCSISSTLHNKARGRVLEKCKNGCGASKWGRIRGFRPHARGQVIHYLACCARASNTRAFLFDEMCMPVSKIQSEFKSLSHEKDCVGGIKKTTSEMEVTLPHKLLTQRHLWQHILALQKYST